MCKMKNFPQMYEKARVIVRLTGINPEMPGYEMLIKAIVTYKVDGPENLLNNIAKETSVIPSLKPLEKDRHPVEQMMIEAMRSIGCNHDSVLIFIKELAKEC